MTKQERIRLAGVLRATEYLFLENIALKLVLEHRAVTNWQKLLDRLLDDKEMLTGVRLKFSDLRIGMARSAGEMAASPLPRRAPALHEQRSPQFGMAAATAR